MNLHNYNHLFYFYVTAKLNGVTVAANYLNTSQSSLSSQIKTLEGNLGKDLFRKNGRSIQLTEFGKETFNYCRRAFEVFDEMFDQLNKTTSSMGVRISVGVSVDIERAFVTDALAEVSKQYPMDQRPLLNLISLPTAQLQQLLLLGEIDLLLTTNAFLDSNLEILSELDLPVGLFATQDLMRAVKLKTFDQLIRNERFPLVLPSKLTTLRAEIDTFFIQKKLVPICVFESNIFSSVIRAAADNLGATLLPEVYLAREVKLKGLKKLNKRPLWNHRISLLAPRNRIGEVRKRFAAKLEAQLRAGLKV